MIVSIISTQLVWFVARVSLLLLIGSIIEGASYIVRETR